MTSRQVRLKVLCLVLRGGLGNRLRALASARRISQLHQVKLLVRWEWDDLLSAFAPMPDVTWLKPFSLPSGFVDFKHKSFAEDGRISPRKTLNLVDHTHICLDTGHVFGASFGSNENEYVTEEQITPWLPEPSPHTIAAVEAFEADHNLSVRSGVGLHIRSADDHGFNVPPEVHPLPAVELMQSLAYGNASEATPRTVFLCANTAKTEHQISTLITEAFSSVPPRVVTRLKEGAHNRWPSKNLNPKGLVDDYIDFLLLARRNWIVGSNWSSFSRLAVALNQDPRCRLVGPTFREIQRPEMRPYDFEHPTLSTSSAEHQLPPQGFHMEQFDSGQIYRPPPLQKTKRPRLKPGERPAIVRPVNYDPNSDAHRSEQQSLPSAATPPYVHRAARTKL